MNLNEFGENLGHSFATTSSNAVEGTTIFLAGQDVCEMVHAYWQDGITFLEKGDTINAVAAFGYAYGWLYAGQRIGVITTRNSHYLSRIDEIISANYKERLNEKMRKYFRLLTIALQSLRFTSEDKSSFWKGALRVLDEARGARDIGLQHCIHSRAINALVWFSYGHGWLDAGVRIGLFRIRKRKELFTI